MLSMHGTKRNCDSAIVVIDGQMWDNLVIGKLRVNSISRSKITVHELHVLCYICLYFNTCMDLYSGEICFYLYNFCGLEYSVH